MLYSSIHNPKIKDICRLKQKKYRDETSLFIVEGEIAIREAYKKKVLKEVFLLENKDIDIEISKNFVTEKVMKYLSSLDSIPNAIGICKKEENGEMGSRIILLEDVQDPGNIGTIIRSAVAFYVDTIVLSRGCADPYSSKVLRATQGMIFHINIKVESIEEAINEIKQKKIPIYGTKVSGGKEAFHLYKREKFAIIMGNEGKGLKEETLDACDEYLYIKMNPLCESLNVGVATSILLYELDKK